jgi:hypothetical protein
VKALHKYHLVIVQQRATVCLPARDRTDCINKHGRESGAGCRDGDGSRWKRQRGGGLQPHGAPMAVRLHLWV